MKPRNPRLKQEGDSPLESLRVDFTELDQNEFIVACGFKRTTYYRWLKGEVVRLTIEQIVRTCRVCNISVPTLIEKLGGDIGSLPQ